MSLTPMLITSAGTTTTYLPLSTAYPFQAACSSLFVNEATNGDVKLHAVDPNYGTNNSGPDCLPSEAKGWWTQSTGAELTTRTELGGYKMVCPAAYKTVAMSVLDESSTMVGGYDFINWAAAPTPMQCSSPLPPQMVTYVQAAVSGTWITTSMSVSITSSVLGIQVNGILFATPKPTGTSASMSATATPATAGLELSEHHGSGLSKGAKIGIGVGVAMGVVLLCALLVVGILYWMKIHSGHIRSDARENQSYYEGTEETKSSLKVKAADTRATTQEVGMG